MADMTAEEKIEMWKSEMVKDGFLKTIKRNGERKLAFLKLDKVEQEDLKNFMAWNRTRKQNVPKTIAQWKRAGKVFMGVKASYNGSNNWFGIWASVNADSIPVPTRSYAMMLHAYDDANPGIKKGGAIQEWGSEFYPAISNPQTLVQKFAKENDFSMSLKYDKDADEWEVSATPKNTKRLNSGGSKITELKGVTGGVEGIIKNYKKYARLVVKHWENFKEDTHRVDVAEVEEFMSTQIDFTPYLEVLNARAEEADIDPEASTGTDG